MYAAIPVYYPSLEEAARKDEAALWCDSYNINMDCRNFMKKLSYLFIAIAILLSNIMCSVVAFNYRDMLCGIEHLGYSAPASVAFLSAIPFGIGIIICAVVAYTLYKKSK